MENRSGAQGCYIRTVGKRELRIYHEYTNMRPWYRGGKKIQPNYVYMKEHNDMKNTFDEAYETYADMVFRFSLMKVSDRDIAKDITQDTFVKAWDFLVAGNRVQTWRAFLRLRETTS